MHRPDRKPHDHWWSMFARSGAVSGRNAGGGIGVPPHSETEGGVVNTFTRKILHLEGIGFGLLIIFLWLDELLDLPEELFGASPTPVNWRESIFESVLALALGAATLWWTYVALARIRFLEGFLHACMFCKKIRTGDQWIPIESYVSRHSEAVFSHTLCPECSHRHYAGLSEFGKGELTTPDLPPATPAESQWRTRIEDGVALVIRPVKGSDEPALRKLFQDFAAETKPARSLEGQDYFTPRAVPRFCMIDYDTCMTLVATILVGETEKLVGCAFYLLDRPTGFAQCALVVAEGYRRSGLGTSLVRRLTESAERRGIRGFSVMAPLGEDAVVRVFQRCGYAVESLWRGGMLYLRIPFEGPALRDKN